MKKRSGLLFALGVSALAAHLRHRTLLRRWLDLPPVQYDVYVAHNQRVPMPDGVTLAADHYMPRAPGNFPTILIRTPYGRGLAPAFHAQRFAERGYHVLVQDVRGRFGSEGFYEPFLSEAADGQATVAWLEQQPWFNGVLGTWGQSYLGYTQWALAATAPSATQALFVSIASSRGVLTGMADGVPLLELPLRWMVILEALEHVTGGQRRWAPWRAFWRVSPFGQDRIVREAFAHLPLQECDELLIGEMIPYYRQALGEAIPEAWQATDVSKQIGAMTGEAHLLGGWYDLMLQDLLGDYGTLRAAGKRPYLTVGPWKHIDTGMSRASLREALFWFDARLKGNDAHLRAKPVRLYVMGAEEWRDYDDWPPPFQPVSFYLQADGQLSSQRPVQSAPDHYVYDPADPTPSLGGALFGSGAGPCDNCTLEARPDVLTYTTLPLTEAVEVIGTVKAVLYVRSSLEHTDFFARLCDVYPDGRSMNVCDGIYRIVPGKGERQADGSLRIEIDMWGTAYRFQPGHAMRLQISSGAHPHYARNLGTGAPLAVGTSMRIAEQTLYHDEARPSALVLPLLT